MHPGHAGLDQLVEVQLIGDELRRVDEEVLSRSKRQVAAWDDTLTVTTEVAHGPVVPSLVAAAKDAGILVLGHHRMTRSHHLPTFSITHSVAARTTCPVLAVPDDWHELHDHPGPVVAAVEDGESGHAVAAAAFAEAHRSGAAVRVVRAWSYADLDADEESLWHGTGREQGASLARATTDDLADLVAAYRGVPSRIDVVHGQAAFSLVEASRRARLVVIGRHRPTLPWGSHLGPVTRAVLGHACCPVMVVDTVGEPVADAGSVRESAPAVPR
jgi:nucleotide-binding universal stress UspA family protein